MVQAKDPPAHYLSRLRTYLDPKASRSSRVSEFLLIEKKDIYIYIIYIYYCLILLNVNFMLYRNEKWLEMPLLHRFCEI